jgi:hypothetical protein
VLDYLKGPIEIVVSAHGVIGIRASLDRTSSREVPLTVGGEEEAFFTKLLPHRCVPVERAPGREPDHRSSRLC